MSNTAITYYSYHLEGIESNKSLRFVSITNGHEIETAVNLRVQYSF